MYWIEFNNLRSIDLGLAIPKRVARPSPEKNFEEKTVPGGDGNLYKDKGYRDIIIPIPFNFVSNKANEFDKDFRKVKNWINKIKDKKLRFSDDLEYFYKVKKVVLDTQERSLKRLGRFTLNFTCEPYNYLNWGAHELKLTNNSKLINNYELSKPIIILKGEGAVILTINNNPIKINVSNNLLIDSVLGVCYRNGDISNKSITGDYRDMFLVEGINTISWNNNNISVSIIPNWRCY